jgi:spectinomycin phosphotransferase
MKNWGLVFDDFRYFPEGGGAYHWVAHAPNGSRWFVTIDDLDTKPWLGDDRDSVFGGLLTAYRTAMDLEASGCAFVVAPVAGTSGAQATRIDDRHSVSVFKHVDGEPGRWGRLPVRVGLNEVVAMLAELHLQAAARTGVALRGLEIPGRRNLEDGLSDLGTVWDGGPLSEAARRELATHAATVQRWLADLDRFATRIAERGIAPVLTHGEPHPGNLIHTNTGLALVDWDTVAMAPPERDLWMIAAAGDRVLNDYHAMTGINVHTDAVSAYRLLWALADVSAFVVQLRGEHRPDVDARRALEGMRRIFDGREPSPYGTAR